MTTEGDPVLKRITVDLSASLIIDFESLLDLNSKNEVVINISAKNQITKNEATGKVILIIGEQDPDILKQLLGFIGALIIILIMLLLYNLASTLRHRL